MKFTSLIRMLCWAVLLSCTFGSGLAEAYVGPGAGFAFVSSFFILFMTFALAFVTILTWPIRGFVKFLRRPTGNNGTAEKSAKRVVIVGLDGLDPELTERFMKEGLMPNFDLLQEKGVFTRLGTTLPAASPVAWSSFQTGCNPGKHRIYDFLVPNRKSLLPELNSARVEPPSRHIKVGKYRFPLGKPRVVGGRKSKPFWYILGENSIFSTVLRVPLTFPPEKFNGVLLSAMCTPDLKGSQGTFFYYTSNKDEQRPLISGIQLPLELRDGIAFGEVSGPENMLVKKYGEIRVPFKICFSNAQKDEVELIIGKECWTITMGEYSPWIRIDFRAGLGIKVSGICRFMLLETSPHVRLYMTPLQIDPEKPALPISYPSTYSIYLAKSQGTFATLGVTEDTSALNESIISEDAFLSQCDLIHEEREKMFFDALEKTPEGLTVCVFDITDRVQHMFLTDFDNRRLPSKRRDVEKCRRVIRNLYQNMDEFIGRVMGEIDEDTIFMVMSDHGFKPFRREVNLNAWLKENGYLALNEKNKEDDMLQSIDWSRTKAYTVGFGGIYLNMTNREAKGIVKKGQEAKELKREIRRKLMVLYDEQEQIGPVAEVYDRKHAYKGPYVLDAPDLIVGFKPGYRTAWHSVTGGVGGSIIQDNVKPWGGDHIMNPADVPGIFFCNRPIRSEKPNILDIAPTVVDLFGLSIPSHMDGESLGIEVR